MTSRRRAPSPSRNPRSSPVWAWTSRGRLRRRCRAPPAYRPAAAPAPRHDARMHAAEPETDYVAPNPPPSASPRPRRWPACGPRSRPGRNQVRESPRAVAAAPAEQHPEPSHRGRLGIGSLINRMTGHTEDAQAPAERRQPPMSGGQPHRAPAGRGSADDGIVDPEQERIEIPAFLRRQPNLRNFTKTVTRASHALALLHWISVA